MKIEKDLERYLLEKNIYIAQEYFKGTNYKSKEDIIRHLKLISKFQSILSRFNGREYGRVFCNYGKEVEKIKSSIIILDYLKIEETKKLNGILKNIDKNLDEIDIKSLIKRSIAKNEISIGRVDEKNLRVVDEIEIGKIKKVSYGLVEEEIIDYLRKVKKNLNEEEIEEVTKIYVDQVNLTEESLKYIKEMTVAPFEVIRYINKYRSNLNKRRLIELINMECKKEALWDEL